jgi:hypothetical protein
MAVLLLGKIVVVEAVLALMAQASRDDALQMRRQTESRGAQPGKRVVAGCW